MHTRIHSSLCFVIFPPNLTWTLGSRLKSSLLALQSCRLAAVLSTDWMLPSRRSHRSLARSGHGVNTPMNPAQEHLGRQLWANGRRFGPVSDRIHHISDAVNGGKTVEFLQRLAGLRLSAHLPSRTKIRTSESSPSCTNCTPTWSPGNPARSSLFPAETRTASASSGPALESNSCLRSAMPRACLARDRTGFAKPEGQHTAQQSQGITPPVPPLLTSISYDDQIQLPDPTLALQSVNVLGQHALEPDAHLPPFPRH